MAVKWNKCKGGIWCELFKLNIDHEYFAALEGVFILWYEKKGEILTLNVGSGNIVRELKKLKTDLAVKAFAEHGLYVTWAEIASTQQNGVLVYLSRNLMPKFQSPLPKALPIKIPLPWDDELEEDD